MMIMKSVWPTWVVGALFKGARCIHINHITFPSLRARNISLFKGRKHLLAVCQQINPQGFKEPHMLVEGKMYP
jgi:hypothetical protein